MSRVQRGLERREHQVPSRIGIDEKSLTKGHRYAIVVAYPDDPTGSCGFLLVEGRTKEALVRTALGTEKIVFDRRERKEP
jgi:hypothetical protein